MNLLSKYLFLLCLLLAGVCQLLLADPGSEMSDNSIEHPAFCRPDYAPAIAITPGSPDLTRHYKIDIAENEVEEEELNFSRKGEHGSNVIAAIFYAVSLSYLFYALRKCLLASEHFHAFRTYRSYISLRVLRI